jgi:hypothetical protein
MLKKTHELFLDFIFFVKQKIKKNENLNVF